MIRARRSFGKYRLIAEIGHGGMANVYLAIASGPAGFNKLLVIKQIRPELAHDPAFLSMFLDEARLAARVNHPNVVQTIEVGEEGGGYFLAMEYLDGQPLSRVMSRAAPGQISLAQYARVFADVLAGLHHAHTLSHYDGTPLGVVHRDATPQNVFVTYDGQIKVVDFGVAKAATSSGQTGHGVLKGKLSYMAPEQARGDAVDRRADLFSVGVMLWEAIAGRRMWEGVSNDVAILHRLVTGQIPALPGSAPPELAAVCARALAFDREARFSTAAEMRDALERWLEKQRAGSSNREIGALVASLFVDERAKIQATVNEQLAQVDLASSGAHRSALPLVPVSGSFLQAGPPSPADEPPTIAEPLSGRAPSSFTAHPATSSLPPPPAPKPAPPGSRRWPLLAGITALVTLLGAVGGFAAFRSPPSEAAAAASASSAPALAKQVEVRLAVLPESARLFFDDQPLPSNPHTLSLPADGHTHLVRAEAEGYLPRVRQLVLDKDFAIELALERAPAPAPTGAGQPAPTAGQPAAQPHAAAGGQKAAPPDGAAPKKPGKGRRNLDADNPYAQ